MNCQHEGCTSTLVVDCIRPELMEAAEKQNDFNEKTWQELQQQFIEYFCTTHCRVHNYCWSCGFHQKSPDALDKYGLCRFCKI